eukprot:gene3665-4219_t
MARKITQSIVKPKRVRARVLNAQKGDFVTLSTTRGDIIDIVERVEKEKDVYMGSNGYKTGTFSAVDTKTIGDFVPPADAQRAICVRDVRGGRDDGSLAIMRGDVLAIIEHREGQKVYGRMKQGLDGWGADGVFPLDAVRILSTSECALHEELTDVIMEVSERLMDDAQMSHASAKDVEKRQLQLRDKAQQMQAAQDAILCQVDAEKSARLQAGLRRDIEATRALLACEFYICDPLTGGLLSDAVASPVTLLREHYTAIGEKKAAKFDKLGGGKDASAEGNTRKWEYGHIVLEVKMSRCTLRRNVELQWSLFNFAQARYVTEQMVIVHDGSRESVKLVFKDIEQSDLSEDVALVCRVVRRGTMKDPGMADAPVKKGAATDLRRPYGAAAIRLLPSISEAHVGVEKESTMMFWTATSDVAMPQIAEHLMRDGDDEAAIKKHGVEPLPKTSPQQLVPVSLSFFDGPHPSLANLPQIAKLEHKTVVNERTRHVLYVTLDTGKFTQGKHIELTVRVRLDTGDIVPNCIASANGTWVSEIRSVVCHNTTNPMWAETLQLAVPPEKFLSAHLLITVKNASSKAAKSDVIGFSFLKLAATPTTALANAEHSLLVYKASSDNIPPNYIADSLASSVSTTPTEKDKSSKFSLRKNEIIKVRTLLHTTHFIQHASIAQLLDWRSNEAELPALLDKFKFVEPVQIMRHLKPIVDALFRIYDSTTAGSLFLVEPVALLVYNTLVFIIGLLMDERTNRFTHFKRELDAYIEHEFAAGLAHKHILNCLAFHMQDISAKESAKLAATLKALEYMFRLMVKSRLVYLAGGSQGAEEDAQWRADLGDFLSLLNRLMGNTSPQLIVVQTLALRNFAPMMRGLTHFYGKADLCRILCEFVEAVHYSEKQEHLNSHKLSVFVQILAGPLPLCRESIEAMLPTLVATVDRHISTRGEEARLSIQLLAAALEALDSLDEPESRRRHFNLIMTVFGKVLNLADSLLLGDSQLLLLGTTTALTYDATYLVTCLLTMLNYVSSLNTVTKHIADPMQPDAHIRAVVKRVLRLLDGLVARGVYSSRWPIMQLFHHRVAHRVLVMLTPLLFKYSSAIVNDLECWNVFFSLQFNLLSSPIMRTNSNRIHRLEHIQPLLTDIRTRIIKSIRDKVLDKIIIRERVSDEQIFRSFLTVRLEPYFADGQSLDAALVRDGKSFTSNIIQLLSLLFDFRTLPTDRSFEEERTIATLKMMEYFRDRKDTYIKYLHELLNQHINSSYFTEAGHTLLLHSDLYEWNNEVTLPMFSFTIPDSPQAIVFPQETITERKIRLIRMAIQYLERGNAWEKCILLIQDLKIQYEESHNLRALSEVIFQEADLYEKIVNVERFYSEYFRVGYYGRGFPTNIQGREYLYKGYELERLSEFTGRILAKFPNAELLKTTAEPTPDILNADAQYLLITIVNPSSLDEIDKRERKVIEGTPVNSKNYLRRNNVNVFVYSKPFEKPSQVKLANPNNKFADLWIRNHFLITDSIFPTIHRRAEVIKKTQIEVTPIENAISSVCIKNEELDEMVQKYDLNAQLNLNPLAMALNGSIDAAVNGGVSLYKEAFFDSTANATKDKLSILSQALKRQVEILERGLYIHSVRCPEELRGLHDKLETFFPKFKSEVMSL